MYNPRNYAFLTRDPVEGVMARVASRNGYGYVEGNPTNWTDPSGRCVGPLIILCGAAILGGAAIVNDWRGQVYANQMAGMDFWSAVAYQTIAAKCGTRNSHRTCHRSN